MRIRLVTGLVFVSTLTLAGCRHEPKVEGLSRDAQLHQLIESNLHFDWHCWCRTANPSTISTVVAQVTDSDIPILARLLGDRNEGVANGAEGVLVALGDRSRPALLSAKAEGGGATQRAERALALIDAKVTK